MDQTSNASGSMGDAPDGSHHRGRSRPGDGNVAKKVAQQGQWRTPPLPAFAATPASTEYARALQEAYQRGAEAGLRALAVPHHGGGGGATAAPPPPGVASAAGGGIVAIQYAPAPVATSSGVPMAAAADARGGPAAKPPPSFPQSQSMPDLSRATQAQVSRGEGGEGGRGEVGGGAPLLLESSTKCNGLFWEEANVPDSQKCSLGDILQRTS